MTDNNMIRYELHPESFNKIINTCRYYYDNTENDIVNTVKWISEIFKNSTINTTYKIGNYYLREFVSIICGIGEKFIYISAYEGLVNFNYKTYECSNTEIDMINKLSNFIPWNFNAIKIQNNYFDVFELDVEYEMPEQEYIMGKDRSNGRYIGNVLNLDTKENNQVEPVTDEFMVNIDKSLFIPFKSYNSIKNSKTYKFKDLNMQYALEKLCYFMVNESNYDTIKIGEYYLTLFEFSSPKLLSYSIQMIHVFRSINIFNFKYRKYHYTDEDTIIQYLKQIPYNKNNLWNAISINIDGFQVYHLASEDEPEQKEDDNIDEDNSITVLKTYSPVEQQSRCSKEELNQMITFAERRKEAMNTSKEKTQSFKTIKIDNNGQFPDIETAISFFEIYMPQVAEWLEDYKDIKVEIEKSLQAALSVLNGLNDQLR